MPVTVTKIQNAPNVILQTNFDCLIEPRDYGEDVIVPKVNEQYSDPSVSTVKVVDMNGVTIGSDPRPRP